MSFGTIFSTIAPIAGSLLSGASKTKPYTVDQTPYWISQFPEYKQGYQQLLSDYMTNVYNKPYQPAYHMRRATEGDSPYLQTIQQQLDSQLANEQQPAQPAEQAPTAPAAPSSDATAGRGLYTQMLSDPYGMMGSNIRGGKAHFMEQVPANNPTDEDFAKFFSNWSHTVNAGMPADKGNDYGIDFASMQKRLASV